MATGAINWPVLTGFSESGGGLAMANGVEASAIPMMKNAEFRGNFIFRFSGSRATEATDSGGNCTQLIGFSKPNHFIIGR